MLIPTARNVLNVCLWPLTAAMARACRGSFREHSSLASRKMARQLVDAVDATPFHSI